MVAAVDKRAIPRDCEYDEYIIDAEEYAIVLKTRVIQKFMSEGTDETKDTSRPGNKDGGDSEGYILYMTYKLLP